MSTLLITLLLLMQGVTQTATGTVTGRLLSPAGIPTANVRVALSPTNAGGELIGITQTDTSGRYRIENVPLGQYFITAGFVESPTYLPGVLSRASATAIPVTARSTVEAAEFRLAPSSGGMKVAGRVILEGIPAGQAPPLSMRLNARAPLGFGQGARGGGAAAAPAIAANVAANSTFEIFNVPPGRYGVIFLRTNAPQPEIEVGDRDVENLQFTIPFSSWLVTFEATIKVDGVAPIPPVVLTLTNVDKSLGRSDLGYRLFTDPFAVPLFPAGEYSVKVSDLPPGYSIKSITAGTTNLLTQNLKATPIDPPRFAITLSVSSPLPGVRVVGRVTNQDQASVPQSIEISGVTPGLKLLARIQPNGSFEFPMVPRGTYDVEFTNSPDVSAINPVKRTITVGTANPTTVQVPLRIANLRKITVTIADRPRNSVFPFLQPTDDSNSDAIRATVGFDGKILQFLNVPPGSYQIFLGDRVGRPAALRTLPGSLVTVVVADKDVTVELRGR